MVTCQNCAASLEARWKFCIYCGTTLIPAAIRPDGVADSPLEPGNVGWRPTGVFILGMVLVGIGIAILATFIALRV